jgi:hypothetical protein
MNTYEVEASPLPPSLRMKAVRRLLDTLGGFSITEKTSRTNGMLLQIWERGTKSVLRNFFLRQVPLKSAPSGFGFRINPLCITQSSSFKETLHDKLSLRVH